MRRAFACASIILCAAGLRVLLIDTTVTARAVLSNATLRKLSSFAHLAKGDMSARRAGVMLGASANVDASSMREI